MNLPPALQKKLALHKQDLIAACSSHCGGKNPACDCQKQFMQDLVLLHSGIPFKFVQAGLSLDRLTSVQPDTVRRLTNYVEKLDSAYKRNVGLYLYGSNGLGKSYSACIVLKQACLKQYSVLYTRMESIISKILNKETREDFKTLLTNANFAVIDEINKVARTNKMEPYIDAIFDDIFRTRAEMMQPTILIANEGFNEEEMVPTYGHSLWSLFNEHLIKIPFLGSDVRLQTLQPHLETNLNGSTR